MKLALRFLALAAVLMSFAQVLGAVPALMNFQGILKDGSGNLVADGSYPVAFTLYDASIGGTIFWAETTSVSTTDGLFSVVLGSIHPVPDSAFNTPDGWLGIQVAGDPEMTPRQRLASVAYSFRTEPWTSAGQDISRNYGNVGIGTAFPGYRMRLDVNNTGSDPFNTYFGMRAIANNNDAGGARAGDFTAGPGGSGPMEGVTGTATGTGATTSFVTGVSGRGTSNSGTNSYGVYGEGTNSSTGYAYGGYFRSSPSGTGTSIGVGANAFSPNGAVATAVEGNSFSTFISYGVQGFGGSSGSNAYGGYFSGSGATGSTGVYGTGASSGVVGYAVPNGNGVYGEGFMGVSGYSSNGWGVYGYAPSLTGVYGNGGIAGGGIGVYGTASGVGSYAGYFVGDFLATGVKSAAVKTDNGRYHLMYAQESPENWFEDFGTARLANGRALVSLDPTFAQTVNTRIEYHVFLTPEGDCRGLYVTQKAPGSFEIRELQGGTSSLPVSYRVVAKRRGYENVRLPELAGSTPEELNAKSTGAMIEQDRRRALDRTAAQEVQKQRAAQEQASQVPGTGPASESQNR